jgi:hypothetical protein
MPRAATGEMPHELSPRHLRKRLLQLALLVALVALVVWLTPGLGALRKRLDHAAPGWLLAAAVAGVAASAMACHCCADAPSPFSLFDIAVLGLCYRAFGYTPPFAVLVFAYLIGQLGGLLPLPGRDRRNRVRAARHVRAVPRAARGLGSRRARVPRATAVDPGRARQHRIRAAARDAAPRARARHDLQAARRAYRPSEGSS